MGSNSGETLAIGLVGDHYEKTRRHGVGRCLAGPRGREASRALTAGLGDSLRMEGFGLSVAGVTIDGGRTLDRFDEQRIE